MKDQKMFRLNLKEWNFPEYGFHLQRKKDLKSAENIYKEMIAYSPKSTEPYLELAPCWIKSEL
jgi:hypothetical protein